tara:strand:+ start:38 stop:1213 length:1176 start_codon:yes stop_codon:yes gene_type:complete
MAATETGVWDLQDVRDKQLQSEWDYDGAKNLYMVGVGNEGSMGNNLGSSYRSSPVQIPGSWKTISGSYRNSAGVKSDGTLWSWGYNQEGSAGQNNRTAYSSPVQVGTDTDWNNCLMATQHACYATKTDGTMWSWGENNDGILGHNNQTKYSSPVQVGTDTTWDGAHGKLSGGHKSVGCIKTDGSLWRWGANEYGQLGHNNTTQYSSPRQVPGTWTYFSGGHYSALQIKAGEVYFTGWGERYANGIGSQTNYSSPRQVPGSPGAGPFGTVTKCASMEKGTGFVINTDGELFSWGYNANGQCGKNTGSPTPQYYSPQQVAGTTWSHVETARTATYAQKTDGTLWAWGNNFQGYLGQNNQTYQSSPVQIGTGTSWELDRTKSYWTGAMGLIEIK